MDIKGLIFICDKLKKNRIPYALGGSGLLYYLGLIDKVNDWDLMVECSKEELLPVLEGLQWKEEKSGDFPFASQYRIHVPELNIDFIGSFALDSGKEIVRFPLDSCGEWDGVRVSCPEIWYVAYQMMGRESKAELLREYLKNKACQ